MTRNRFLAADWAGLILIYAAGLLLASLLLPNFATDFNVYVMLRSASVSILVALSQSIVLAVGQMNLALGALGGLVAILFGAMLEIWGLPLPVALTLAIAIGVLGGLLSGVLIAVTGINAFIITLATGSIFAGLNLGITEARPYHGIPKALVAFGDGRWGFMPALLWPSLAVAPLLAVFLRRTLAGRRLLAVGGNAHAAELSGISTRSAIVLAHALSGLLAAAAAILAVAQLGAAQPEIGATWLLVSFAAPIIGGADLSGGHISVLGAILAVLLIALIENALVLSRVDPYWVQFALGALVLATVALNRLRSLRRSAA